MSVLKIVLHHSFLRLAVLSATFLLSAVAADAEADRVAFFEKKVRPVLVNRCYACHSADTKPAGGLRVDDRNGLLRGGDSGAAVVPGDPTKSILLERILHVDPKKRMPKEGAPVTETELADLTAWVLDGAAWPREAVPSFIGRSRPSYEKLKAEHWAWQPLTNSPVPLVQGTWVSSDIDRFILAKLQSKGLSPVGDADRINLIRRVTFDLTGLPPTPAEIDAFTRDTAPEAYARLVDRLLESPRFGERWGRHWLDVARYAESTGPSRNIPYPHAWRYRDYVIDSINRDVPFNRFVQEQIAGDLLPAKDAGERDRLLVATGFLALGAKDVNQRFQERFVMDNVDEQIDTVSRSILGLTVSCARCHDHKFDPIPVTDYYALAGIFTSTENSAGVRSKMGGAGWDYYVPKMLLALTPTKPVSAAPAEIARLESEVAAAKKKWTTIRGTPEGLSLGADGKPKQRSIRLKYERLQGELYLLTDPGSRGYGAHGVRDAAKIADAEVRIRGEAERLGPTVPRGFLTTFSVPGVSAIHPAQSGRLELAQWLTSEKNSLTPRVIVNRLWQHLFGQGIVTTVDNFGIKGNVPSHPELLDYLASRFISGGWSIKRLVREIALSHTYRLSSDAVAKNREIDPANRFLWRHSPRRLDAEEIRDAMLAASGRLVLTPPKSSPAQGLKMMEMPDNGTESRKIHKQADDSLYRSVYLPLLRGLIPRSLEAFDPVTQTLVTGQRDATTVPTQALYMLNASFVRSQSLALAADLLSGEADTSGRLREAYRRTLGRLPTTQESVRACAFLAAYQTSAAGLIPTPAAVQKADDLPKESDREDQADQTDEQRNAEIDADQGIHASSAEEAAWMSFVQTLYASAEFRFVR